MPDKGGDKSALIKELSRLEEMAEEFADHPGFDAGRKAGMICALVAELCSVIKRDISENTHCPATANLPDQPMVLVDGEARFKPNLIVRYFVDRGVLDLDEIAPLPVPREDLEQFLQLIGYSAEGYCDHTWPSKESKSRAWDRMREILHGE